MEPEDIQKLFELAVAPLKAEIAELRARLNSLPCLSEAETVPAPLAEARKILKSIPHTVLLSLDVTACAFDPNETAPWFRLLRSDGTVVSVKKRELDFRIRVRKGGALVRQLTPSLNGLVGALKSLAAK